MPLTLEQTQTLIAAAHEHAAGPASNVTVAVVDEGGLLKALGRMDGAPPLSAQIAEAKAVGAARVAPRRRSARLRAGPAGAPSSGRSASSPGCRLIPADGSVVIRDGGTVLGAVGVSGAKPEEDRECAEAGVAAIFG